MDEKETGNALYYMINFFGKNIQVLNKYRPKVRIVYNKDGTSSSPEGNVQGGIEGYLKVLDELGAFNTSLVLNCFSLFEASFECRILHGLDIGNLEGIQKSVMLKYIRDVLKLSNINNYAKEFEYITGMSLKEFFTVEEYEYYQIIKSFYVLRHLLSHGSASMNVIIPEGNGGKIEIDESDSEYQKLLKMLEEKIGIKIANKNMNVDKLLQINDVVSLLIYATYVVSSKFTKDIYYSMKALIPDKWWKQKKQQ